MQTVQVFELGTGMDKIVVGMPIARGQEKVRSCPRCLTLFRPGETFVRQILFDQVVIVARVVYPVCRGNGVEVAPAGNHVLVVIDVFLSDTINFILANRLWA